MRFLRFLAFFVLLAAVVGIVLMASTLAVVAAALTGVLIRSILWGGLSRSLPAVTPVAVFALILAGLQWLAGMPVTLLGLKAVAVFLFSTSAFRLLPWEDLTLGLGSGGRLRTPLLFLLFTRHFTEIMLVEATRVFRARSLCIRRPFGRAFFSSLAWALVSLFSRSISRAERFYAAQLLRGLGQ